MIGIYRFKKSNYIDLLWGFWKIFKFWRLPINDWGFIKWYIKDAFIFRTLGINKLTLFFRLVIFKP